MKIKINGKTEEIQAHTVIELLRAKDIEPQMVSVELNSKILDREAYSTTGLKDGDSLEFLFFMGGGEGIYPASTASERGRLPRRGQILNLSPAGKRGSGSARPPAPLGVSAGRGGIGGYEVPHGPPQVMAATRAPINK